MLSGILKLFLLFTLQLCDGHLEVPMTSGSRQDPHRRYIDLSHLYDNTTQVWPGDTPYGSIRTTADSRNGYFYASNDYVTGEHCGTHLDAPYHFNEYGWKVADIPIERLFPTGIFINASTETNGNSSFKLPVEKIYEWEKENGPFPNNSFVLIDLVGLQGKRYGDMEQFLGPPGQYLFPGMSKEAAEYLVQSKKVIGAGTDSPSIDQGKNTIAHRILHKHSLYVLEHVAILEPLPPVFKLVVMPMKLAEGSGAPCRVVAIL